MYPQLHVFSSDLDKKNVKNFEDLINDASSVVTLGHHPVLIQAWRYW